MSWIDFGLKLSNDFVLRHDSIPDAAWHKLGTTIELSIHIPLLKACPQHRKRQDLGHLILVTAPRMNVGRHMREQPLLRHVDS